MRNIYKKLRFRETKFGSNTNTQIGLYFRFPIPKPAFSCTLILPTTLQRAPLALPHRISRHSAGSFLGYQIAFNDINDAMSRLKKKEASKVINKHEKQRGEKFKHQWPLTTWNIKIDKFSYFVLKNKGCGITKGWMTCWKFAFQGSYNWKNNCHLSHNVKKNKGARGFKFAPIIICCPVMMRNYSSSRNNDFLDNWKNRKQDFSKTGKKFR